MAFRYLAGPLMNLVGRGAVYGASKSGPLLLGPGTADASYPLTNLYNGVPALPFRLSATTTGTYVAFANNLVYNGDFEQTGLTGWTATSATLTSETAAGYFLKGVASMKVVASGAGGGAISDTVLAQAGEYLQIWAAARGNGTNNVQITVRCLDTNQDLNSSGVWSTIGTFVMTRSTATMAAITPVTFQVPSFSTLGRATARLQVRVTGSAASTFYVDEVLLVPGVDFVGVFGHGFERSTGVTLATSGANYWHSPSFSVSFGATSNAACASQTAVVTNTSRVYDPFPAVFFYPGGVYGTYSTVAAPWIGELVVGQMATVTRNPESLVIAPSYRGQQRGATRGGTLWVHNANAYPVREARLSLVTRGGTTDAASMETEFLRMTEGGRYPTVLLPVDLDSTTAIYGRVTESMSFAHKMPVGYSTTEAVVTEEPLPRME